MGAHRLKRLEEEIQHLLRSILLFEMTDPDLQGIALTQVKVTKDLGIARIYYEGTKGKEKTRRGLERARGFLRRRLASRLNLRTVPELEFFYDETAEEASRLEGLFEKL